VALSDFDKVLSGSSEESKSPDKFVLIATQLNEADKALVAMLKTEQ
jgi:hypothetical protein